MPTSTPFRVECPPQLLERLKNRLSDVIYADESLPDSDTWAYGMPPRVLRPLVDYWRTQYDWKKWEARINEFKHYKMTVNGTSIHFIHHPSPRPDAIPLIMTHGWPGSFLEFLDLIKPLAESPAREQAFHVVVPSLPGYGFSEPAKRKNFAVLETARAYDELMRGLGYSKYIAQGGDLGSSVSKALAIAFPGSCKAMHLNMAPFIRPPKSATLPPLTPDEESRIVKGREFQNTGTGYQRIQATKPQTIGAALSDSPVGLLAWIGEKFHEWSDLRGGDGDFSPSVSKDHLITNVMIYLCANTISSSFMFYHYSMLIQLDADLLNRTRITCPSGISAFPREIFVPPRSWCEYWCPNLVQWTEPEKGGHFAALEQPERLIADVRMFGRNPEVRKALGMSKL